MSGQGGRIESLFRHKEGHSIWIESAWQALADGNGKGTGLLITSRDITKRKQVERQLLQSNNELKRRKQSLQESLERMRQVTDKLHEAQARYERLVKATHGFVYFVALDDGKVVGVQHYPGCELVTGYTAEEYERDIDLWNRNIHPDDTDKMRLPIEKLSGGNPVAVIEHRIMHRNGGVRWLRNTSVARRDDEERLVGYEGLITDITDFKKSEAEREALTKQLRKIALHDSLTGLMNRRGFEEELNRLWSLSRRHPFPIGLLVIDIDHFKTLNDSYGHVVGDRILNEYAKLILRNVRDSDIVCRFGGDEMTVILPWSEKEDTRLVARRILQAFRSHLFCKGEHDLQATASIGMTAVASSRNQRADRFLARADKALYRAKQLGRNRLCEPEEHAVPAATGGTRNTVFPQAVQTSISGRVLVVDDDASILALCERMLAKKGFDVFCTRSVAGAIELMKQERGMVDAALVDLNLGVDSGLELMERMREIDDTAIRIVITGQASVGSAVDSLRSGAYDFVQKPFSSAEVVSAVQRAIQYRRALIENRRYQTHLENMVREKSATHTRALKRLRASLRFTLEAMAAMLDARERKTGEHSKRVAIISRVLAREMNVAAEDIEKIETGALLHDIGKIGIPDSILMKPGPLSDEEREIMRQHPQLGYDIIQGSDDLKDAAEIVLAHQEHFDGKGYPRGLKGEEICLGARVFAVADAYDAMRAERPYSASRSAQDALAEIVRHKGTQFDPDAVDALASCQDEVERIGNWPVEHGEKTDS